MVDGPANVEIVCGHDAVSYTHLDVYKRQQLQRVHVIGIAADKPLHELDLDVEIALAGPAHFFSGTAFDWHTTQAVFPSHYLKSSGGMKFLWNLAVHCYKNVSESSAAL